ncbi:MAG: Holliday junction resolvase RuvX [Sneathiella sp.]|nr:Holliday junction resolvase RuvX [Sneathiella sp.]
MLLGNPTHLKHLVPKDKRLLGMDPGTKTIGLALSDAALKVGTPLMTIKRTKFKADAEEIRKIIDKWNIGGFVIGLPINMDGSEGPRCQSIRQFQKNLEDYFDLPMCFWDERLSTVAVTRAMLETDTSRAKRAKAVDKMAAAYILQGALDAMR